MKSNRIAHALRWSVATLTLAFCGGVLAQDKVRMALPPVSEALAAVAADRQGFFKAEGIEVEMSKFTSSAMSLPLMHAEKLDVALSNVVSTLLAIDKGMDVKMIAAGATFSQSPAGSTNGLVVRKGEIASPRGLEGKRIGINVVGGLAWLYLVAYLDQNGIDRSKVRIVEIPFPQMTAALLNKSLDAAGPTEPFMTVMLATGKAELIGDTTSEVQPGAEATQYLASGSWLRANPDVALRFTRALRKGYEFITKPENQPAVREMNVEFTGLNRELKDTVRLPTFAYQVDLPALRKTQQLMVKYGLTNTTPDLSTAMAADLR